MAEFNFNPLKEKDVVDKVIDGDPLDEVDRRVVTYLARFYEETALTIAERSEDSTDNSPILYDTIADLAEAANFLMLPEFDRELNSGNRQAARRLRSASRSPYAA